MRMGRPSGQGSEGEAYRRMSPCQRKRAGLTSAVSIAFLCILQWVLGGCAAFTTPAGSTRSGPQISLSPASLTFGSVTVGSSGKQSLTVSNNGSANLSITAANVTGSGFSTTGLALPMTVPPGGSGIIAAQFVPLAVGNVTGSLSIVSNTATSPTSISLTGSGSAAAAGAQISVNPSSIAFGTFTLGSANPSQQVTISNLGTASLTITSASITDSDFSITGLSQPITLAAAASTSFKVNFVPAAAGTFSGSLSLVSNAPTSPTVLPLSGTATTSSGGSSNPLSYNAVTDTLAHNSAPPTLGAAGTTTTDPDFSSEVLRVTQSASCGVSAGRSFSANEGTGWLRTVNSNDTAVLFVTDNGAWYVQPLSLAGTMSLNGSCVLVPFNETAMEFSATNPDLVFGLDVDGIHFDSFNWTTNVTTQLVNVHGISGFSPTSLYLSYCDSNDAWCATSSSTQDKGTEAAFYNLQTGHTAVVNLAAATVQLDSNSPVAMDNVTAAFLAGCGIHEMIPSLDGTWWDFTVNGCSFSGLPHGFDSLYWQVGTNHVAYIQDTNEVGGHEAMGNGVYINAPGASVGCSGSFVSNAMALWNPSTFGGDPGNWVGVTNCSSVWTGDFSAQHFAWLNNFPDSSSNSYPILNLFTTASANAGDVYEWELIMIDMAAANAALKAGGPYQVWPSSSPTVWRIAHTYNDPFNNQCPAQAYQSPNISQDGKYALFTSDWLGQTGVGTCANARRTDVFLVQMPLP